MNRFFKATDRGASLPNGLPITGTLPIFTGVNQAVLGNVVNAILRPDELSDRHSAILGEELKGRNASAELVFTRYLR